MAISFVGPVGEGFLPARDERVRKEAPGLYLITLSPYRFGTISRKGKECHAEIRDRHNGNLVRYAGIWPSRKAAAEELLSIPSIDL